MRRLQNRCEWVFKSFSFTWTVVHSSPNLNPQLHQQYTKSYFLSLKIICSFSQYFLCRFASSKLESIALLNVQVRYELFDMYWFKCSAGMRFLPFQSSFPLLARKINLSRSRSPISSDNSAILHCEKKTLNSPIFSSETSRGRVNSGTTS